MSLPYPPGRVSTPAPTESNGLGYASVSYTHLTLPTILLV